MENNLPSERPIGGVPSEQSRGMRDSLTVLGYSDLEGIYDDPERVARLASFLAEQRDDATLIVGAGDDTALGVAATVSHNKDSVDLPTPTGRALAAPFFRAIAPDAETFGNHDFDHGPDNTREYVRNLRANWTCANLHDDTGLFGVDAGVQPTRVLDTAVGRVGVFGVTTPQLPAIAPSAATLCVGDPVEAARVATADLRERADHVVGLSHCGQHDPDVAAAADADLVVGGHRHERYADTHDGTLLVRTGGTGVVEATVDGEHVFRNTPNTTPDPALVDTYTRVRAALGLDEIVARVNEPVKRDEEILTAGESRLGNFVADAYRAATDADVGVMHAGSLRAGPSLAGEVSAADVISVSPFGNRLTTLSVSGTALRAALTDACPSDNDGRWFLSVSGASVTWDDAERALGEIRVGGEPVDDDREYTVAIQEYLVDYDGMRTLTDDRVLSYHGLQYDHLVAHARTGGLAVGVENRITRVDSPAGGRD
jgi:2',3'-cyclic-nucleotide 2'-phosphodiesterase (5'-nucleotidase family)